MRIYCPECDAQSEVPSDLLVAGIRKLRCRCCGIRYRVLPSGDNMPLPATTSSNPAQPISDQHAALGGAGFGQGSDDRPRAAAGHGADLPNLSVCQSPGSAWAGGVATVEQLDFPRLVLGSVFRHKYRIDAEIGQGGSAVVYRAHDLDAEMDVALKVVGVASSNSKLRTMATGYPTKWCQRFSTHSSRLGRLAKPPAWGCPSFARSFFRIAEISKCEQQKV